MARPKTARLQTAYDLGHEHGRTGSRPAAADDVIGGDAALQEAYDTGLRDGTDSLDADTATPTPASKPRHRVTPTSGGSTPRTTGRRGGPSSEDRLRAEADAHSRRQRKPTSSDRFSHPLHWGSGARGHVIGRPRLTPPTGMAVRDWTGFGFGLFLYALGSAYISYGPGGPTAWLKAKFLNDTSAAAALTANGNASDSRALHQLLVTPQRAPQVAPPPAATPPGSLGFLFTQPTAPTAKP